MSAFCEKTRLFLAAKRFFKAIFERLLTKNRSFIDLQNPQNVVIFALLSAPFFKAGAFLQVAFADGERRFFAVASQKADCKIRPIKEFFEPLFVKRI